jgi:hypothetical protein
MRALLLQEHEGRGMDDVNDHQSLKREKLDGKGAPACCWIASAFMIAMMRNSRGS